jgi:uncharacterized protein YjbJ (UPF0337 family)
MEPRTASRARCEQAETIRVRQGNRSNKITWEEHMNGDQIEGQWKQMKGQLREKWGSLTDDDVEMIAGKRDQLIGRLQVRYGIAKEEAAKQVEEFASSLKPKAKEPKELKRAAHQS